jgi:GntR family transcriptional regulator
MLDQNVVFNRDDWLGKLNRRTVDPSSPAPLYYQLYTMLRDAIASGALQSGSKMPSEIELAATFDVSRNTARRALAELASEEMVVRRPGRGTVVDYSKQLDPIHAPLTDLMQGLDEVERNTKVTALQINFAIPPVEIAEKFGDSTQELCNLERLRNIHNVPYVYYNTWTRGFERTLTKKKLETNARFELFVEYGIEIARIEQFLSAERANPEVARALTIGTGKPLLKRVRYSYDKDGELVDYLTGLYNPDLFSYKMEATLTPYDVQS